MQWILIWVPCLSVNRSNSGFAEAKDDYGIYSYFVGDTLISGKIYLDNPHTDVVKYEFTQNVISNDLKYGEKKTSN